MALLLPGVFGCDPPPDPPPMLLPSKDGPVLVDLSSRPSGPPSTTPVATSVARPVTEPPTASTTAPVALLTAEQRLAPDEVMGTAGCAMCHGNQGRQVAGSAHGELDGAPLGLPMHVRGCEVCHGGGRRHMAAPPGGVRRDGSVALCGPCHRAQKAEPRHGAAGVRCSDCHMPALSHGFVHPRKDPEGTCGACHDGKKEKALPTGEARRRATGWHEKGLD